MSFRLFRHVERTDHTPNWEDFDAICPECKSTGTIHQAGQPCNCGGTLVINCAYCTQCDGKHLNKHAGEKCACGGEIGPPAVG